VAEILSAYTRIKIDQTTRSPEADAVARRFGVMGVPTVIVINSGEERFRITGFEGAEQFLKRLE